MQVRTGCFQAITAMINLKYVPRDYEIYTYAIYAMIRKGLTGEPGKYIFPVDSEKFRRAIANATYNLKQKVLKKIWHTREFQELVSISIL